MRRFAAVALREIAERRSVLVAAAAAAVLPFLVPLLPSVPGSDAATARALTALVLACAFGVGGAVLVGASVVGRELAEKRLSFHFARPLSARVIWGGKLVGGLALVLLAELVVYLPASLASGRFPGLIDRFDAPAMAALLLLAVPLFLLAWVASVTVRSRSPWLVVDFVLLAASAAVVWSLGKRLLLHGQAPTLMEAAVGVVLLLTILGAATFALVASGRTDARRGHGAQSVVLWGGLGIFLLGLAVWVDGKVDPGYETFVHLEAEPTGSSGDWILLTGTPKTDDDFRRTRYLVDLRTGRSVLLPVSFIHTVSADGSRATWIGPFGLFDRSPRRTVADLRSGDSTEYPIGGLGDETYDPSFELALSADGSRLAFLSAEGVCDVTDLATGRLLASARVPGIERWFRQVSFESRDVVRIEPRTRRAEEMGQTHDLAPLPPAPALFLLDVPSRTLKPVGTALAPAPFFQRVVGPTTTPRAFVRRADDRRRLHLVDLSNGAVLASFGSAEAKGGHVQGGSLADGRLFVKIDAPGTASRIVLLSPEGTTLREVSLPDDADGWDVGLEAAPGVLPVARPEWLRKREPHGLLVDLNTGRTRALGRLRLGVRFGLSSVISPVVPPPVGSPATRLFRDADTGRLVLLDPATGERKALTRGRPSDK
jgi:hypothetical protein